MAISRFNKLSLTNNFWNKQKILVVAEQINFVSTRLHCYVSYNSPWLTVWMKKTSKFLASGLRSFVLKQKKTYFKFRTSSRDQRNNTLPKPLRGLGLLPGHVEKETSPAIFDLCLRKTLVGKSHDYRDNDFIRFKMFSSTLNRKTGT